MEKEELKYQSIQNLIHKNHPDNPDDLDKKIIPFKEVISENRTREERVEEFIIVFNHSTLDSMEALKIKKRIRLQSLMKIITGAIAIAISLIIIISPIPRHLEILTVYYFNPQDGITISDLVALIIMFSGVFQVSKGIHLE